MDENLNLLYRKLQIVKYLDLKIIILLIIHINYVYYDKF